ncbi:DNA-binding transcriptional regulator, LysR family [Roseovarius litoreus]|uniref:DNA-binding transcriptional regulator, LysR family n=1 Tax=Roseovarius litoreus TaxID=1155722 RepID=A0A1M7EHY1_9RHOB|nr:LysR family transcriptional regulator [Roseovarius litoreus]SHL91206.1 DNA-binding transcriptional regulator, LysR family [Roseovarius litoreus]
MRLDWLEDILAVLDTGSFARAAEARNLTQSAFTRRIRSIEDGIGTPLFDRSRKPVQLLAAVRAHEDEMRRMAADLRALRDGLRRSAAGAGRTVALACQHAITTTVSPRLVQILARDRAVRVRSGNRDDCLGQLITGEVDIAVIYDSTHGPPRPDSRAFEEVSIGTEPLVAVCAPALAPLSGTSPLPVITYPGDVFLGRVVERAVFSRLPPGTELDRKAETALTLAACQYALDGIGIAWLPLSVVHDPLSQGRLVRLPQDGPDHMLDLRMIRLAEPIRHAALECWDALRAALPRQ